MIQRVQTIYLLIVVVLLACLFGLASVSYATAEQNVVLLASGLHAEPQSAQVSGAIDFASTWPLTALTLLAGVMALLSIFLFKRRMLQIRLCAVNIVLLLGLQVMLPLLGRALKTAYFGVNADSVMQQWHLPAVFPVVGAILTFLALRAIGRDEALVRSLDRLR